MCASFSSCQGMFVVVTSVKALLLQSSSRVWCRSSVAIFQHFSCIASALPCQQGSCHWCHWLVLFAAVPGVVAALHVVVPASSSIVVVYALLRQIA